MSIRIYIATTDGPVEIQRITVEDPTVRSVVCLDGTAKALPISRAYDSFVKEPTGVIQRSFGQPSYRMDLDKPITDGNSWQLATFVAHMLLAEDLLAVKGDAVDNVIWLTGELDRDLNIRAVEHIEEKIKASKAFFDDMRAQNIRVFCFIPGGRGSVPDDDFLEEIGVDGEMLKLESIINLRRIATRFDLKDPYLIFEKDEEDEDEQDDPNEEIDLYKPVPGEAPPLKDNRLAKIGGILFCLLALAVGLYLQFEDNIIALRSGSLRLGIAELRANADQGCTKPDKIVLERDGNAFPTSPLDGLCALEITLNNVGSPAYLWAFAQRIEDGHLLLADRESLTTALMQKGLIGWHMVLPKNLSRSIDYRLVGLASSSPLGDAVNRMIRRSLDEDKPDWEQLKAQLVEEKITVISVLHSLER